ncbi:MAG TPA: Zn-ribbon domain-containing OB-fold protein [Acidimicrobiales bacterium]|nr:Zn-ribbon domain-containing OB-fold protein [Acidimicrobiales bacterium]
MSAPTRFIAADDSDEFFWRSGADGVLRFLGCGSCGRIHHPPVPRCPHCGSRDVAPQAVSGRATVATYTVNHQPFMPGFDPPYVIAMVEIEDDPTVRLTTNIVGCAMEDVHIGMPVEVTFEPNGEWFVPLFRPLPSAQVGDDYAAAWREWSATDADAWEPTVGDGLDEAAAGQGPDR